MSLWWEFDFYREHHEIMRVLYAEITSRVGVTPPAYICQVGSHSASYLLCAVSFLLCGKHDSCGMARLFVRPDIYTKGLRPYGHRGSSRSSESSPNVGE
jgi:hypothetical protein